ncbi:MAG: vWA domain-containing protein, partial [Polyangiaceae bacterium]
SGGSTSTGGSGGSTSTGGSGGSGNRGGTGGSGGAGGGGGTTKSDASVDAGGSGGSSGMPDGGTSSYAFPFTLTPLTSATTSTSNISLYFSVTDKNGVGVAGLPTTVKVPADPNDPFGWVYKEDGTELDPKESGFSVSPLQGSTLDMPTVLVLDLSGSIVSGTAGDSGRSLLQLMKDAAIQIVRKMLPEQRMAIVTFAGASTVRVPFTTDKAALESSLNAITSGDGQSTNLYGAMIQAFSMWQDGFATAGGVKLTAGLAIVLTDGKDNAGLNSLSDALAARKNKRVVAVGINDPDNPTSIDTGAMQQLATTGTFVPVKSFATLGDEVTLVTDAMSTLGRSIYTANYCTPKRAGTNHNLLFTLKGNESMTTTTCTPATFPSNHPSLCAQLGAQYTQACGYKNGGSTTYYCCTATAPYTCPNDNSCYRTAADAAAKCGTASSGGTCLMCGGSGAGSSQDTGVLAGPAIRVKFDASTYKDGQCPIFWGPNCKALQTCCQQSSSTQATACNSALLAALGNETTCQSLSNQYCGTSSPEGGADVSSDGRTDGPMLPPLPDGWLPPPPRDSQPEPPREDVEPPPAR